MGREWTIKSFRSGNSTALRVPAGAGIAPGEEWRLVEDGDGYRVERVATPKRKFNIDKVWGCAAGSGLQPLTPDQRIFEDDPRPYDDPQWSGWDSIRR